MIGLRELGEAVDEVSKRLGHESTAFTLDTYGHLLPQRGRNVAAAFDRLVRDRCSGSDQAERAGPNSRASRHTSAVNAADNGAGGRTRRPVASTSRPAVAAGL